MWLKRVDPATIVSDVLGSTAAPASGALPAYGHSSMPSQRPGPQGSSRAEGAHGQDEWEYAEADEPADPYRYTARG
jgi:MoxR-like ATPase